jgi:hypothetical protein
MKKKRKIIEDAGGYKKDWQLLFCCCCCCFKGLELMWPSEHKPSLLSSSHNDGDLPIFKGIVLHLRWLILGIAQILVSSALISSNPLSSSCLVHCTKFAEGFKTGIMFTLFASSPILLPDRNLSVAQSSSSSHILLCQCAV